MSRTLTLALVAAAAVLVLILSSVFVVEERQKALVLQFGQIRQVREEPGLGFKVPFIQQVAYYDDRILSLDTEEIEVTPSDDRRLRVDAFARFRIDDVVRFRQAVGNEVTARDRLSSIINAQIREVLGADQVTSDTILSADRRALMTRIRDGAQAEAASLGLLVVDVRLKTTNLPIQNLEATFARMRSEREREAADEIARGNEAAQRVRAQADRTVTETISEAQRDAEITRGEADAEANAVFAQAYSADPEFFQFYRSMQAYEESLRGSNSTMVMTPDNDFLGFLYAGPLGSRGGTDDVAVVPEPATAGAVQPEVPARAPAPGPAVEPVVEPAVDPATPPDDEPLAVEPASVPAAASPAP